MSRKERVTEVIDLVGFRTASRKNIVYLHRVYQNIDSMSANSRTGTMEVEKFLNTLLGKMVEIELKGYPDPRCNFRRAVECDRASREARAYKERRGRARGNLLYDCKNIVAEVRFLGKSVNDKILSIFETQTQDWWLFRRKRTYFGKRKYREELK